MGGLIGRIKEKQLLEQYVESEHSEFIAIYGRRRIGKTFLVTETLGKELDFDMTGVMNGDSAMYYQFLFVSRAERLHGEATQELDRGLRGLEGGC